MSICQACLTLHLTLGCSIPIFAPLLLYKYTYGQLAADRPKVKGLIGGLPPASALWNLKLALAYYSTSQARLLSDLSTIAGMFFAGSLL